MDYYGKLMLVDKKQQPVDLHIGSNDITKFNYHDIDVNDLVNRIIQIVLKYKYYRVESIE